MKSSVVHLIASLATFYFGIVPIHAQYVQNFQNEYFQGNLPNARTEAMGKTDVALGNSVSSSFLNPAGIGLIESTSAQVSTSGPYYVLYNSRYYYAGGRIVSLLN